MKKMLSVLLAAMMLISLLAVPALAEDQVLTVVTWDATTTPYLIAQKEAFEASHPGVTIEYIDVDAADYPVKAGTMLAGSAVYDVYMIKEIDNLLNWQKQGFAASLADYVAGYDMSGFKGTEVNYAVDGVQYAIPFRSDFWVLYYNKDLFEAAGVEAPNNDMTWEDYKELALKMTDTEKEIYGTHYHTWLSAVVNWAVCGMGGMTLADGNYDSLGYFYHLYQDLEDAGACMRYDDLKASGLKYAAAFENGNIAMLPMGYWLVSTLIGDIKAGNASLNWGIVSVPHYIGDEPGSSFGNLTGTMINEKSENKDLAWEYISWLGGPEGAKATASVGARPAWVSEEVADVMASVEGFPADDASKAALLPSSVAMEWPAGDKVPDIKTIVNEEHSLIMAREISIEEGIEEMNERVTEVLLK